MRGRSGGREIGWEFNSGPLEASHFLCVCSDNDSNGFRGTGLVIQSQISVRLSDIPFWKICICFLKQRREPKSYQGNPSQASN